MLFATFDLFPQLNKDGASDVTCPPWKLTTTGESFSFLKVNCFGVLFVLLGVIPYNCSNAFYIYIFAVFDPLFFFFCEKSGITPLILVVGVIFVIMRFIGLGTNDQALYIFGGIAAAIFLGLSRLLYSLPQEERRIR